MYAIIETGGKQYKVSEGDVIKIEVLKGEEGSEIKIDDVLLVSGNEKVSIGTPKISGASVLGVILRHGRKKKIKVFHYKKTYKKRAGHRQNFTELKVKQILLPE